MNAQTVCVVGLGYIGLPTAALLATRGFRVHGVDISANVVETINRGEIHIVEPDLDALVAQSVASGALSAATEPSAADIFMICVPTPFRDQAGEPEPDMSYVLSAARQIAPFLRPGNIVILESTSPVGSTRQVADTMAAAGVDIGQVHFAYCPERVLPGRIIEELVTNARVVGGLDKAAAAKAGDFYRAFVTGGVFETEAATAEMCKLAENSFRDVNIAFANELSLLCADNGVDVWDLIRLANRHPRVNILQPGTGVGGHCIAVDPWFLVAMNPAKANLIRTARKVNLGKTEWVVDHLAERAGALGRANPKVACLGLAFKPDIDDLRESPAMEVVRALRGSGLDVVAVEPNVAHVDGVDLVSLEEAMTADLIAILVAHKEFRTLARADHVIDLCGALS